MSKQINPPIRLGILGGGQLARMLALRAHNLGIAPHVLSENKDDPAQQVTSHNHIGSLNNEETLKSFFLAVDVVTFESEFLDSALLTKANQQQNRPIYPSPQLMASLQDRYTQKTLLDQFQLPTAPWCKVDNLADCAHAVNTLGLPLVFKKRRFGYDGYGTFVVKNKKQLEEFQKRLQQENMSLIAEKWIPFSRELACIFARNISCQVVSYPLVESLQKDSRCFWVKGPITHKKWKSWIKDFEKFLNKIKYVGVMGLELFETSSGLLVNELAPRVHNSGHYTLDAFSKNQFDLHLLALLNQDLTLPKANTPGFAMVNLLGSQKTQTCKWTLPTNVQLHWYGKSVSRPGRKMGHINALGSNPQKALTTALKAHKRFIV